MPPPVAGGVRFRRTFSANSAHASWVGSGSVPWARAPVVETLVEAVEPGGFVEASRLQVGTEDAAAEDAAGKLAVITLFEGCEVAWIYFGLCGESFDRKATTLPLCAELMSEAGYGVGGLDSALLRLRISIFRYADDSVGRFRLRYSKLDAGRPLWGGAYLFGHW